MFKNKTPIVLLFTIILGVMLYVMGCGDYRNPLAGGSSYDQNVSGGTPPLLGISVLERGNEKGNFSLMDGGPLYGEKWMDHKGGKLKLEEWEVKVEKDAILGPEILVSIQVPDPSVYFFELGPEGYQFEKDVEVTIKLNGFDVEDAESIHFYTYEGEIPDGEWVQVETEYDARREKISVYTSHFSYWALASD